MAKHHLAAASSRDLSLFDIATLTRLEAIRMFAVARWGSYTHPACPSCGVIARHKFRPGRRTWVCKECWREFSAFTGTVFADRKMPETKLLSALLLYSTSKKGISAMSLNEHLKVTHLTSFVLVSKVREALLRSQDDGRPLSGLIQVDGAHFCGKPRRLAKVVKKTDLAEAIQMTVDGNRAEANAMIRRKHRQYAINHEKRAKRRIVFTLRECSRIPGVGGIRTRTAVAYSENAVVAEALVAHHVAPGSEIWTDENSAYSGLSATHLHKVVKHADEFVTSNGVHENQAESFFGRMRRAEYGVFHGMRTPYLADYAAEFAWREDTRTWTARQRFEDLLKRIMRGGLSRSWRGYWQGYRRRREIVMGSPRVVPQQQPFVR